MISVRIELPDRRSDDRVALRPVRSDDAPAYVAAFRDDPDLGRLLGLEVDPDEDQVRARVAGQAERAAEGRGVELAIADSVSDAFQGSVILHSFDWHNRRCEVGVWVVPSARRRHLASAAVALAVDWALSDLDLLRVEMTTTPENAAVPALARRLGFTREGRLRARNIERGQRVDVLWFGMLREEWPGTSGR
jgi:RimJ/RimL family protein N-acetyltransferase